MTERDFEQIALNSALEGVEFGVRAAGRGLNLQAALAEARRLLSQRRRDCGEISDETRRDARGAEKALSFARRYGQKEEDT